MPKMMLKFEAEKNLKITDSVDPGRSKGRFLGSRGGREEDFRPYLADFVP